MYDREEFSKQPLKKSAFLENARPESMSNLGETDPLALSFAQQRLWFFEQLNPGNPVHHLCVAYRLVGHLNVAVLEQSLTEIARRHQILRTTFTAVDGQPIGARVLRTRFANAKQLKVTLPIADIRNIPAPDRETEIQRLATEEAQQLFDLAKGPLWRVKLLHLDEKERVLLLTMHNIISDRASLATFVWELATLYEAFCQELPSPLPELSLQYADFAKWQRQWLSSDAIASEISYWKQQLGSQIPVLDLPTDALRSPFRTYRGARQSLHLPIHLSDSLKTLSQQEGITPAIALLAAFKTLLYRYSGTEDIIVGIPIANRDRPELESLIGLFVNTLATRTYLGNDPNFRQLLAIENSVVVETLSHQYLPFEKLVEELQLERDTSRHPLFQVTFDFETATHLNRDNLTSPPTPPLVGEGSISPPFPLREGGLGGLGLSRLKRVAFEIAPMPTLKLSDLTFIPLEIDRKTAQLDLHLSVRETEKGWQGFFEYNADLFEAETMARMAGHFQTLLEGIIANPDMPISQLPLLTDSERHQLLVEWNPKQPDYPNNVCLHQLVETQVEKTPDAIAIIFDDRSNLSPLPPSPKRGGGEITPPSPFSPARRGGEITPPSLVGKGVGGLGFDRASLTYRELNQLANQLAHYLQNLGVKPEVPVGICMDLCLDLAVGILAIVKAGGILVPLDPTYPKERLAFILEDAKISVLLTQKQLLKEIPTNGAQVVCLDARWEAIAQESEENPISHVKPEHLAYILYTSGSTGKPKGVMLSHFVCCTRELWEEKTYPMTESGRILLKSSWSSKEFFWPLLAGATAVMMRQGGYQDSAYLVKLIAEQKITVISVVPSVLKLLLEEPNIASCTSLRHVFCTGEAMPVELVERFKERLNANLYNLYGLNEANYATVGTCDRGGDRPIVPIGRATDLQIYLLDSHLKPVPIGVTGELHISGIGLANGYLNRPDLTAQKFIANPFSDDPNARLFKTGDLARYLPDGNIEYIGRIDHQVKIRGNRIELREIETVLLEHLCVEATVVISREDVPGEKRLVAYITLAQNRRTTTSELRSFLKQKLPNYMVPAAFVILEALPLTFNGKINRLALPAPESVHSEMELTFVEPRTAVEKQIANIWATVLRRDRIGIHDDFFELGGHSLLATQVVSRLRQAFGIAIPLQELFEVTTIASLGDRVETFCWAVQNWQIPASNSDNNSSNNNWDSREEMEF